MTDKSGETVNIEIAQRLQERFEAYWLGLIFTLLALSVQTAKFGVAVPADVMELLSWVLLLIAGLAGLSRFEWIPEIYRLRGMQIGKEEYALAVQKEMLRGTSSLYVAPLKREVPAAQYLEESRDSARRIEEHLTPIEQSQQRKYRIKKRAFVGGICLLIGARAYVPLIGILHALSR